jgi:hypothetical protein
VHVSALKDGNCLHVGDEVSYDETWDERKRKTRAENLTGASHESRERGRRDSRRDDSRSRRRERGRY